MFEITGGGLDAEVVEKFDGVTGVFGGDEFGPAEDAHRGGLMSSRLPIGVATSKACPCGDCITTPRLAGREPNSDKQNGQPEDTSRRADVLSCPPAK